LTEPFPPEWRAASPTPERLLAGPLIASSPRRALHAQKRWLEGYSKDGFEDAEHEGPGDLLGRVFLVWEVEGYSAGVWSHFRETIL